MAIEYQLDCVFYQVSDMDRAIAFYTDVLGLELDSRGKSRTARSSKGMR